jgi:putative serine protease PepD
LSEIKPTATVLAAVAAAVLMAALAGCTSPGSAGAPTSPPSPSIAGPTGAGSPLAEQQAFVNVIKKTLPSVVEIRTNTGLGSGVVFDAAGDIVTNNHVVAGADSFQVVPANSATPLPARLVGAYPPDDLAMVRVEKAKNLRVATFANSSTIEVGDIVLAMGNPLGLSSSVTQGIISAVGRTVTEPQTSDSPGATLPDAIQTSAAINPGNSGGALVNLAGQVVGIPTLAAVDQQLGGGAAPGIGFAIPSNIVTNIGGQLAKDGRVTNSHRAALGVRVNTVVGPDGQPAGAGIVDVTAGGPADKAGLRPGDVITSVNGTPVTDTSTLSAALAGFQPGQQVSIGVTRADGSTATVRVTLGQLPG